MAKETEWWTTQERLDHETHMTDPDCRLCAHERRLQAVRENSPAVQDGPYAYLDRDDYPLT